MAVRSEQTKTGVDLIIDGFEQGIASSPYKGIANMRNVNTSYLPGVAYSNYKRLPATITGTGNTTIDTYASSNYSADYQLYSGATQTYVSQVFGNYAADNIVSASLYLSKTGSPTGNATVNIYPATLSGNEYVPALSSTSTVNVNALVVAGGGGGGYNQGGGGGGGGYQANSAFAITPQAYTITVGAGGIAGTSGTPNGGTGGNSVFSSITALGGGGGGGNGGNGQNGGSGGGGGGANPGGSAGTGTGGQGHNGGVGQTAGNNLGGGGGGATAVGVAGSSTGNGGAGTANTISGSSVTYAGGGGGGCQAGTPGTGGSGGGGSGSQTGVGTAGTANTGGGGGGGDNPSNGGAGGSGIVIISYQTGTVMATGGTITTSGANTIHTFTTSGTWTVTGVFTVTPLVSAILNVASLTSSPTSTTVTLTPTALTAGAHYLVGITYSGGDSSNYLKVGYGTTLEYSYNPTLYSTDGQTWTSTALSNLVYTVTSNASAAVMANPVAKAQSPAGLNYILDTSGQVWKQSAVNSSTWNILTSVGLNRLTNGAGGLAYWNNYIWVFGNNVIESCGNGTNDSGIVPANWNVNSNNFFNNVVNFAPQQFNTTGTISAGATTATLNANWPFPTNTNATMQFSDGETRTGVTVTNGSTALSWTSGLSNNVSNAVFISSTQIYTSVNPNMVTGQQVVFATTGTLPSPLVPGQIYYIASNSAATTTPATVGYSFTIASSPGGTPIIINSFGTPSLIYPVGTYSVDNVISLPIGNVSSLTFTAALTNGSTSATINSYTLPTGVVVSTFWLLPTGTYNMIDSNGNNIFGQFTFGSSTVNFTAIIQYATGNFTVQVLNPSVQNKAYVSKVDGNLYFMNGESMGSFVIQEINTTFNPGNSLNYQINYATFTLSTDSNAGSDSIVDVVDLGDSMIVAGQRDIYTWNYTSIFTNNTVIPVGENIVKLVNNLNLIYVFTNQKGSIYTSNGSYVQFLTKIPDYIAGAIDPVWSIGDAISKRSRILFQAITQNTSGTQLLQGVFSLSVSPSVIGETSQGITMEAQNSTGVVPASGTLSSGLLINNSPSSSGQDSYYSVFSTGASTGIIDYNSTSLWQNNEPLIETDIVPIGNYLVKGTLGSVEIKLDRPLAAGDSVFLFWRKSLSDSYISIPFIDTSAGLLSNYGITSINQAQWAQFKITYSCASSNSSFIPLRELRLHINQS